MKIQPKLAKCLILLPWQCHAWSSTTPVRHWHSTCLRAIPVSEMNPRLSIFDTTKKGAQDCCWDSFGNFQDFSLGIIQDDDLFDLARFVVTAFGADAIRLSQDMNAFERMLIQPAIELANSYSVSIALVEVLAGVKSRTQKRRQDNMGLKAPNVQQLKYDEQMSIAAQTSLILVLARPSNTTNEGSLDICASVELRLEQCDAKIPFSLPFFDVIERRLATWIGIKSSNRRLKPYLSNLCVEESFRGRGLGKSLVRAVESIAFEEWGYKRVYLHVDKDNAAALKLYESEGYRDVGKRWNPPWAGNAAEIAYYVKKY